MFRTGLGRSRALAGVIAALASPSAALASPPRPFEPSPVEACAVLVEGTRSPQEQTAQPPPVVAPEPPRTPAALRPPDEKELEALASVLEALASPDKSTAALTALGQGRPFSLERFGVLVADVRSVVVQLHARELRARLVRGKELDAETREQLDRDLKVMEGCAPGRFQSRGGSVVFDLVVTLVGKHRARLEPQLFQAPAPPVPKPDAAKPDAPEPKQSR